MGKTVITFMLVLCFITTAIGVGYSVNFFGVGKKIMVPVVNAVNKVTEMVTDVVKIGLYAVPSGNFYFARWYFGDQNEYYIDMYYTFRLGLPVYRAIGGNVDIKVFAPDGKNSISVVTDVGGYTTQRPYYKQKYLIDAGIYAVNFRDRYMTPDQYDMLIGTLTLDVN